MKLTRSKESWRIVKVSPCRAEEDLLVGNEAWQPYRVHVKAALGPPAPGAADELALGRVARPRPGPGRVAGRSACAGRSRARSPRGRRVCGRDGAL